MGQYVIMEMTENVECKKVHKYEGMRNTQKSK